MGADCEVGRSCSPPVRGRAAPGSSDGPPWRALRSRRRCRRSSLQDALKPASTSNGRGGIRTHGGLSPTAVFKTASFDHSDTLPWPTVARGRARQAATGKGIGHRWRGQAREALFPLPVVACDHRVTARRQVRRRPRRCRRGPARRVARLARPQRVRDGRARARSRPLDNIQPLSRSAANPTLPVPFRPDLSMSLVLE